MKILNLCCGATRPQDERWVNLDNLHEVLALGTPERVNLDGEPRYVNHDVISGPLPFSDGEFDGVLASHCVEHWTCQQAVAIMCECRRVLRTGGILLASVPDASYHRRVYPEDTVENAERLFGEPIHLPDGEKDFLGYGLFNRWHKTVLTEDALWCYFVRSGFSPTQMIRVDSKCVLDLQTTKDLSDTDPFETMLAVVNRVKFSLIMMAAKP